MPLKEKFRVLLVFRRPSADTAAMLLGITRFQRQHACWSVFVDDDTGFECRTEYLWEEHWDGVICALTTPRLVQTCLERKVPLVDLTDGVAFPGIPQVRPDNVAVGQMAAADLAERGYRHFAYCGFSNELWAIERRDGFIGGLALLRQTCAVMETINPQCYSPDWAARQVELIAAWLERQPKPFALLACHDHLAAQVLEAARLCAIAVPEDLAVLGVNDDRVSCEMSQPLLSSIALDANAAGYLAAEKLQQLMRGQSVMTEQLLVAPSAVFTRHSTDHLAIADRRIVAALSYIREQACRGVTVEEVVRRVIVSRQDLERGFRKYLGRSLQEEIRRVQLVEIKRLLRHTNKPLKDIAGLTGFEYVEYMCVLFKRLVGETPGKFRKDIRSVRSDNCEEWATMPAARPTEYAISAS